MPIARIPLLACALCLIAHCAAAAAPIKVAALYNTTGGMSSIDTPGLRGAKLAAKHMNAQGGVGGRPIELVVFDTASDPQAAAAAAGKALDAGVAAGIGYGDTNFVLAAAPLFMEKGVPFITSGATLPDLPKRLGANFFMVPFGDDDQAHAIADYAREDLGLKRVAVWTDMSMDFTTALSRYFEKRFRAKGGEVVLTDEFKAGDRDFSALVERLQKAEPKPDAVFVAAVPDEAGVIVKQIRQAGLKLPILSGDGFDTELVATVPGPDLAHGVYFSTHTFRGDARPKVQQFIADYRAEYGVAPESAFAALGYDAVMLVADACGRAGKGDTQTLRQALRGTRHFEGVTGRIDYSRKSGVPKKAVSIIAVTGGAYTVKEVWRPGR
ncbi:ABC transporter substrate-binding protein [Desulfovibrio sulfodismutans]|uniref:ABC transporter substrate-binding protein n=1 Tax=Desulfolutivibrio sulfodismutans TaxID=63561 RepID=A0A7K3NSQ9_9BACT|nr:ABC transporter substrate-binding protein [Desulfolutivibrio sulfodismutans]NDY58279.1 ABC transporter substrate-binding protein [Desulfolutivibrio sulfodismutans]QLA10874.1 ABC transporter substrate-binding protein [Desulfolutivibrio sulfodismutans DSM 3696]